MFRSCRPNIAARVSLPVRLVTRSKFYAPASIKLSNELSAAGHLVGLTHMAFVGKGDRVGRACSPCVGQFACQLKGTLHASIKKAVASAFVQSGNELREPNASPLVPRGQNKGFI